LSTRAHAVPVLRWFLAGRDNAISSSPAYAYRDEGIAVPAARRPSLHRTLVAA